MGNCKDCKYWETSLVANAHRCAYDGTGFHDNVKENGMAEYVEVSDSAGLYVVILTGPLFGCVNFQQQEE